MNCKLCGQTIDYDPKIRRVERISKALRERVKRGENVGRPKVHADRTAFLKLRAKGMSLMEIARALGCSKHTVLRRLKNER